MRMSSFNQIIAGLRTPIVLGPMANAAGGSLAGKVSKAGGLGFIGAGYYTTEKLKEEIQKAEEILASSSTTTEKVQRPQQQQQSSSRIHLGVGFLVWRLTLLNKGKKPNTSSQTSFDQMEKATITLLDECLQKRPKAVWLSFGDEEEMIGWSWMIRKRDEELNGKDEKVKLFIGVGNEVQAKCAIEECGADVLIIQGMEAGGHGLGSSPPLSAILPLLSGQIHANKYKFNNPSKLPPPLLAAGGIMNGQNMAAAMSMGADGVVVGTRMLMTPEAAYSDAQKKLLLEAGPNSTLRTMAFDEARNTLGWPKGVDGRGLMNETVNDFINGKGDGDARRGVYQKAEKEADTTRIVTWAGTGVGLIDRMMNADEVVEEISRECQEAIDSLVDRFKVYN